MMKSKLLHGIIQDLMKVPMQHGEHGPEAHGEHEAGPKGVHITAMEIEKPKSGLDSDGDLDNDMGIPGEDPMDPMKNMAENRAIHAKGKKPFGMG